MPLPMMGEDVSNGKSKGRGRDGRRPPRVREEAALTRQPGPLHIPRTSASAPAGGALIMHGRRLLSDAGSVPSAAVDGQSVMPLPAAIARDVRQSGNSRGNDGLRFDRFCDTWKPDWTRLREPDMPRGIKAGAADWAARFDRILGDADLLKEADARRCRWLDACQARHRRFVTDWRFVSGLGRDHPVENGFAWHHTLGVPYLPGSSVKGMVKSWCRDWLPGEELPMPIETIFGTAPEGAGDEAASVGVFIFLDAIPTDRIRCQADVMTPHYQPYYQSTGEVPAPGDWFSPNPISFLTVAPGEAFRFAIMPRTDQAMDKMDWMFQALTDALEWIGAGAKTATGYGRFAPASHTGD